MSDKDRVYSQPLEQIDTFRFDDPVARVFPDMISRSVPGYPLLIEMIAGLAKQQVPQNGLCYDLGCSLGAVSFALRKSIPHASAQIIAIDNSSAMLDRANNALSRMDGQVPITFVLEDITNTTFAPCDLVILNFTLQFIAPALRHQLLTDIYAALNPNGMIVIAEKLSFESASEQVLLTELHHDFKKNQGYYDLEIAQKRTAIEKILLPDTEQAHIERLNAAGFEQALKWFQCFNFGAFLAIKKV